ncbi:protein DpdG [Allonocardiopsis opalescens]|uniref:Uncharacterized protein n=1 Tax=Allonocardiopsis opalescens TaxID=1144618 RepID=A0A2T0Q2I9_9ACTN|nr:protein DpdG [Allonocardiopsis opalescens]PRX98012.1 hypothetical protein CLV72_105365 [Allonocardiopsis opalescens]
MDYLKSHVRASAPALVVIGRYLANRPDGVEESELHRALRPFVAARSAVPDGSVLAASLAVGRDLRLFDIDEGTRDRRRWTIQEKLRAEVVADATPEARTIRQRVLKNLGRRTVEEVESGKAPSDLGFALSWFTLQDPLRPFASRWGEGPESAFRSAWRDNRPPVDNPEQWRSFMRWAQALGLAARVEVKSRSALTIDPTQAVAGVLTDMPRRVPADEWFRRLYSALPVLGDPRLRSVLPQSAVPDGEIPVAVACAMSKLERMGKVRLLASDDSSNTVALRLGQRDRRIAEVQIVEDAE